MSKAQESSVVHRARYDATEEPSITAAVADAVATASGADPMGTEFVLYDHVDPDALETLYRGSGRTWELTFDVDGYVVTVGSDGDITVTR